MGRIPQREVSSKPAAIFHSVVALGWAHNIDEGDMTDDLVSVSEKSRFRVAMILAIAADALQIVVFPFFSEGALSPADDLLDLAVGAALVSLLGWHWEFLPSFFAELLPGVDFVPFWTLAVANVYRKWKQMKISAAAIDG